MKAPPESERTCIKCGPLNVEAQVETLEWIESQLAELELRLARRYEINHASLRQELPRRVCEEEVPEDEDVVQWQMLYSALLESSENRENEAGELVGDGVFLQITVQSG